MFGTYPRYLFKILARIRRHARPVLAALVVATGTLPAPLAAATIGPAQERLVLPQARPAGAPRLAVPRLDAATPALSSAQLNTVLARRWARTRSRIAEETGWLESCRRGACRDPRAARWHAATALIAGAKAAQRPALAHRLVTRSIRYIRDARRDDLWQTPLTTLLRGAGDCEDHALLKRALLLASGVADHELPLLVLKTRKGEGHIVLQVAGAGLVLDNRYRAPVRLAALAGDRIAALANGSGYFRAAR